MIHTKLLGAGVALGLILPCFSLAAITGGAGGNVLGSAYNRDPGTLASCNYFYSAGVLQNSCGYTAAGQIDRNSFNGLQWNGLPNSFTGSSSASVDALGNLHAQAFASYVSYPVDIVCSPIGCSTSGTADASAYLSDSLTFTSPGTQVPIVVIFALTMDGTFTNSGTDSQGGTARLSYRNDNTFATTSFNTSTSGTNHYQVTTSLAAGASLPFTMTLATHAEVVCLNFQAYGGAHLCSNSSLANFSNTAKLSGITVQDTLGNVLTGYTVNSQSGVNYNSLIVGSVPEPGTMFLAGIGAVVYFLRKRRQVH